jgi:hypothetical protein
LVFVRLPSAQATLFRYGCDRPTNLSANLSPM